VTKQPTRGGDLVRQLVEDPRLAAVNLEVEPVRPGGDRRARQRRHVARDDGEVHQEVDAFERPPDRHRVGGIEPDPAHPVGAQLRRQRRGAAAVASRDDYTGIRSLDQQPDKPAPRLAVASQHQHGAPVQAILLLRLQA
jgi:hypothetical protein